MLETLTDRHRPRHGGVVVVGPAWMWRIVYVVGVPIVDVLPVVVVVAVRGVLICSGECWKTC